jgi:hypothetical protein
LVRSEKLPLPKSITSGSFDTTLGAADEGLGLSDEISSVEQAFKIGIPSVARTMGLQAVFKNDLLFFMLIFI